MKWLYVAAVIVVLVLMPFASLVAAERDMNYDAMHDSLSWDEMVAHHNEMHGEEMDIEELQEHHRLMHGDDMTADDMHSHHGAMHGGDTNGYPVGSHMRGMMGMW